MAKLQKGRGLRLCTIMALHNNGYTGRKRSPPALLSQEPVAKQALTSPVLPAMSPPTKEEMLAAARKAASERRNTLHGCTGAQRFAKVDGQHGLPPLEALACQEEQIAKGSNLAALEAQRRPQRRAALVCRYCSGTRAVVSISSRALAGGFIGIRRTVQRSPRAHLR